MASLSATCLTYQLPSTSKTNQFLRRSRSSLKLFSKNGFHVPRVCHLRVSCAAKPETVEKVCTIVRKQLALAPDSELTPESKFSALGADSLDTVEIIMALEEEFGIGIEEDNAQNISTVQDAADLIEDLVVNQQQS